MIATLSLLAGAAILLALGMFAIWWVVAAVIAIGVLVWLWDLPTWPKVMRLW